MEKDVALDPHGNPISEDDISTNGDVALEEGGDLSERQRLTADVDDDPEEDEHIDREAAPNHQVIYSMSADENTSTDMTLPNRDGKKRARMRSCYSA